MPIEILKDAIKSKDENGEWVSGLVIPQYNLETIAELTLTEDVHIAQINIDDRFKDYKYVILELSNVTLSSADWIYPRVNAISVSGSPYFDKLESLQGFCTGWYKNSNGKWYTLSASNTGISNDLNYISCSCYTSNVNILAGSVIKVYGLKEL